MFGLKEYSYPRCVLISFWSDCDKKKILCFRFIADISCLLIWLLSKFGNIAIHPCSDYFKIFQVCILAPGNRPGKMAAKIQCHSLELEPYYVWFNRKTTPWTCPD